MAKNRKYQGKEGKMIERKAQRAAKQFRQAQGLGDKDAAYLARREVAKDARKARGYDHG